jgi:hypothetical protein
VLTLVASPTAGVACEVTRCVGEGYGQLFGVPVLGAGSCHLGTLLPKVDLATDPLFICVRSVFVQCGGSQWWRGLLRRLVLVLVPSSDLFVRVSGPICARYSRSLRLTPSALPDECE